MLRQITNRCHKQVTCVATPRGCTGLKVRKRYIVNQLGFNGSVRVKNSNGRNVWYLRKYFKGAFIDHLNEKAKSGGIMIIS